MRVVAELLEVYKSTFEKIKSRNFKNGGRSDIWAMTLLRTIDMRSGGARLYILGVPPKNFLAS
jgi:hypothetical protein